MLSKAKKDESGRYRYEVLGTSCAGKFAEDLGSGPAVCQDHYAAHLRKLERLQARDGSLLHP